MTIVFNNADGSKRVLKWQPLRSKDKPDAYSQSDYIRDLMWDFRAVSYEIK